MTGIVTRVLGEKGYGFIRDEEGNDRFICAEDFVDRACWIDVRVRNKVSFTPTQKSPSERKGPKDNGLRCANIEVLS